MAAALPVSVSAVDPSPCSVTPLVWLVFSRPVESLIATVRVLPAALSVTPMPDKGLAVPDATFALFGVVTVGVPDDGVEAGEDGGGDA